MFTIKAISISDRKGTRKTNIDSTQLIADFGLKDDAHAGKWHRQVSFLAEESIASMRAKGLEVVAGNFAENITTEGFDLTSLQVGTHLLIGESELVISQLGKICHTRCAIYHQAGDCVMPREGIFGVIIKGGAIRVGDTIHVEDKFSEAAAIIGTKETESKFGVELKEKVKDHLNPVFIRFDTISEKEGGNLSAILEDLTTTQKIKNIIIFDPTGGLGLALAGLPGKDNARNCYEIDSSTIYYCRREEELEKL